MFIISDVQLLPVSKAGQGIPVQMTEIVNHLLTRPIFCLYMYMIRLLTTWTMKALEEWAEYITLAMEYPLDSLNRAPILTH